ncbi:MAG TPA: hypothetical protein ACYCC3_00410 [Candidatus Azoamicus sp.]
MDYSAQKHYNRNIFEFKKLNIHLNNNNIEAKTFFYCIHSYDDVFKYGITCSNFFRGGDLHRPFSQIKKDKNLIYKLFTAYDFRSETANMEKYYTYFAIKNKFNMLLNKRPSKKGYEKIMQEYSKWAQKSATIAMYIKKYPKGFF